MKRKGEELYGKIYEFFRGGGREIGRFDGSACPLFILEYTYIHAIVKYGELCFCFERGFDEEENIDNYYGDCGNHSACFCRMVHSVHQTWDRTCVPISGGKGVGYVAGRDA